MLEDLPGSRYAAGGSAGKEAPSPSAQSQDDYNHKHTNRVQSYIDGDGVALCQHL